MKDIIDTFNGIATYTSPEGALYMSADEFDTAINSLHNSLYSGGVSDLTLDELESQFRYFVAGYVPSRDFKILEKEKVDIQQLCGKAAKIMFNLLQPHPTPEINEEEIKAAALKYDRRDQSNEPEGADNEDYIGFNAGVKWALSKGAKPLSEDRIKGIRLTANAIDETASVFLDLSDGSEIEFIKANGESIDHWKTLKELNNE